MTMTPTSRGDYLGAKALLGLAAALTGGYLITTVADALSGGGVAVPSTVGAQGPAVNTPAIDGATGHYDSRVVWQIAHPQWWETVLAVLPALFATCALAVVAVNVWRLIRAAQRGHAFSEQGYRRVRRIGIVTFLYGVLAPLVQFACTTIITFGRMGEPQAAIQVDLGQLWPVLVGALVLVLADVFRQGEELRLDTEGLV